MRRDPSKVVMMNPMSASARLTSPEIFSHCARWALTSKSTTGLGEEPPTRTFDGPLNGLDTTSIACHWPFEFGTAAHPWSRQVAIAAGRNCGLYMRASRASGSGLDPANAIRRARASLNERGDSGQGFRAPGRWHQPTAASRRRRLKASLDTFGGGQAWYIRHVGPSSSFGFFLLFCSSLLATPRLILHR